MALTELFGESVRPVWTKSIRMKTKSCDFGGKIRLCDIVIYEKAKNAFSGGSREHSNGTCMVTVRLSAIYGQTWRKNRSGAAAAASFRMYF